MPDRNVSKLYTQRARGQTESRRSRSTASAVKPVIEKGYAVITRDWKAGDKIELDAADESAARTRRATRSQPRAARSRCATVR